MRLRRAVYGSVVVPRGICPDCKDWAFIIKGRHACCGRSVDDGGVATAAFERMSEGGYKRKRPAPDIQAVILAEQGHRCFYCGTTFGDVVYRDGVVPRILTPVWDHVEPFAWQANNQTINFVAACSICNGIKSNKMFDTSAEARRFVWARRRKKGWHTATELRPDCLEETSRVG